MQLLNATNYLEWESNLKANFGIKLWKWFMPRSSILGPLNSLTHEEHGEVTMAKRTLFRVISNNDEDYVKHMCTYPFEMMQLLRQKYYQEGRLVSILSDDVMDFKWETNSPRAEMNRFIKCLQSECIGSISDDEKVFCFLQAPKGKWKMVSRWIYCTGQGLNLKMVLEKMEKVEKMDKHEIRLRWNTQNSVCLGGHLAEKRQRREDRLEDTKSNSELKQEIVQPRVDVLPDRAMRAYQIPQVTKKDLTKCFHCCFLFSKSAPRHVSISNVDNYSYVEQEGRLHVKLGGRVVSTIGVGRRNLADAYTKSNISLNRCVLAPDFLIPIFSRRSAMSDGYDVELVHDDWEIRKYGKLIARTITLINFSI